ncbi:hypothetical protein ARALYDRAFT_902883 [Arabidopsis lyrata subsp. lyrata]|uniref:Peptidase C1A papain C-terminal domain-containing protein n=1 Tax=Arabidopsis lyrata subsp. lyrata TaxID=81972 RepID=D7LJS9_ARALL|nr:hypothetical protein ARALYDRAFT_902883 [Arabidopsis lyrata subsp. lyrata]
MVNKRRNTAKDKGKAPATDVDLPENFPYQFTWELSQMSKLVLLEVLDQGKMGYCWTIAYNRMIGAHLYIHDRTRLLLELSPKHLFAHIEEKFANGNLKSYEGLKNFLKDDGLVREEDCKCIAGKNEQSSTDACDKVKDKQVFKIRDLKVVEGKNVDEKEVIFLLKTIGPIAVELEFTTAYIADKTGNIYYGPPQHIKPFVLRKHIVLLTKYSTDRNGISYFKFQNSYGRGWGDNGYGKFARKVSLPKGSQSLIKSYMYPELLDQNIEM